MTDETPKDSLTDLLEGEQGQNTEAPGDIAALLKRIEENEARTKALEAENLALKQRQDLTEAKAKIKPLEVPSVDIGPVTMLVHPHHGHEVAVKNALVDEFLSQGYKEPKPVKKK